MLVNTLNHFLMVGIFKADKGYRSGFTELLKNCLHVNPECVKSNVGTSDFRPHSTKNVNVGVAELR